MFFSDALVQRYKYFIHMAPQVIFKHVFQEHNSLAAGLSKKALNLDLGHGYFFEFLDGKAINEGNFVLF